MNAYMGSCHCGIVTFEVRTDLEKIIDCNCSHCSTKGLLWNFVLREQFTLKSGEDQLTEYTFNKKTIHHQFCNTCGTEPFGTGTNWEGNPMAAINVRCLHGVDISKLNLTPFDGKDL